ncbi:hypothetical protein, partial [Paracidovorax oryzae]|uniref:hypothetical protein n=1 Tax=Paracidovorax oryzae TaxID=862720 RepID=UPI0035D05A39
DQRGQREAFFGLQVRVSRCHLCKLPEVQVLHFRFETAAPIWTASARYGLRFGAVYIALGKRKMYDISLTDLVDVVSKSGSPKATKVNQIKNRKPYHPATDFYKPLRDGLVKVHKEGLERKSLANIRSSIQDPKKIVNYNNALNGYHKWWGKKIISWFEPPRNNYGHAGVNVAINPELGLIIDNQSYVIKLYLKDEPLSKLRIDLATVLMEISLRDLCEKGEIIGVLDVRQGKFFRVTAPIAQTKSMVDAELAYISSLWPNI